MAAQVLPLAAGRMTAGQYTSEPARQQILDELQRIIGSSHFRNSKRYPALLTYVVEEAIAGHTDNLKERTLGICVFDRDADYDTNADPVVRVSAGEVRKRLAQYYLAGGHEQELRIDLPVGSYLPTFTWPPGSRPAASETRMQPYPVEVAALATPAQATSTSRQEELASTKDAPVRLRRWSREKTLLVLVIALLALMAGATWRYLQRNHLTPGQALFWEPVMHSSIPTLIVMGVHSFDEHGVDISPDSHTARPQVNQTLLSAMTQTDMVHLSDLTSFGELNIFLNSHAHLMRVQGAADTTLEQLREGPFILIGGFNNMWSKRLTQQLRFRFVTLDGVHNVIQDSEHTETTWTVDTSANALANSRDYGLVSCFFDPQTDQHVILAAGIGKNGTEAASDFLTNANSLDQWLKSVPKHTGKNVQVVISTEVIEGKHGPPHVIAYAFW